MRLINTDSLELKEFPGTCPPYAILSHRWGAEEVSFQNFTDTLAWEQIQHKDGFWKIRGFCNIASSEGLEWAWVDTCCIDKSSSAELSEAINSMFKWYRDSELCIVFLNDFSIDRPESFVTSEWFSRGWTLQELIAPSRSEFYDQNWLGWGSRRDNCWAIHRITGIPVPILYYPEQYPLDIVTVAERMRWSSNRVTLRPEDTAYCLLGLFDVHMPLLYGEGAKDAFYRLQCAILERTNDESLFFFRHSSNQYGSALAHLPEAFQLSYETTIPLGFISERKPFHMTHRGLQIQHHVGETTMSRLIDDFQLPWDRRRRDLPRTNAPIYIAPINCLQEHCQVYLVLEKHKHSTNTFRQIEALPLRNEAASLKFHPMDVFVREDVQPKMSLDHRMQRMYELERQLRHYLLANSLVWDRVEGAITIGGFQLEMTSGRVAVKYPEKDSSSKTSTEDFRTFLDKCRLPVQWRTYAIAEAAEIIDMGSNSL